MVSLDGVRHWAESVPTNSFTLKVIAATPIISNIFLVLREMQYKRRDCTKAQFKDLCTEVVTWSQVQLWWVTLFVQFSKANLSIKQAVAAVNILSILHGGWVMYKLM